MMKGNDFLRHAVMLEDTLREQSPQLPAPDQPYDPGSHMTLPLQT